MKSFWEAILEAAKAGAQEAVDKTAKKIFDAGVAYGQGKGPDFETWRAEERAKKAESDA